MDEQSKTKEFQSFSHQILKAAECVPAVSMLSERKHRRTCHQSNAEKSGEDWAWVVRVAPVRCRSRELGLLQILLRNLGEFPAVLSCCLLLDNLLNLSLCWLLVDDFPILEDSGHPEMKRVRFALDEFRDVAWSWILALSKLLWYSISWSVISRNSFALAFVCNFFHGNHESVVIDWVICICDILFMAAGWTRDRLWMRNVRSFLSFAQFSYTWLAKCMTTVFENLR